jgi:hypothetical protein
MRRKKLWFALTMMAIVLILVSCGPRGTKKGQQAAQAPAEAPTKEGQMADDSSTEPTAMSEPEEAASAKEKASSSGDSWEDIPIYPGASEREKIEISMPDAQQVGAEELESVEWRYYETQDEVKDVADFYKVEMPNQGWEERMWMDFSEEMSIGQYQRRQGEITSMIQTVKDQEGTTFITIMRGEGGKSAAMPKEATTEPEREEATPAKKEASSADGFWADIPVYGGASEREKIEISVPGAQQVGEGEFERLEWRYYETQDEVKDVAAFYKEEMPKEGWQKLMWMDFPEEVSMGQYRKQQGEIVSMIQVAEDQEGTTLITIWRGEGKK